MDRVERFNHGYAQSLDGGKKFVFHDATMPARGAMTGDNSGVNPTFTRAATDTEYATDLLRMDDFIIHAVEIVI